MQEKITAVILCGGIGKRLFPISTDKSLLEFNGLPLIYHQVSKAKQAGLNNFVIITGETNHKFLKTALSNIKDVCLNYIMQKKPKGMADALITSSSIIGDNPFILISSNDVYDVSAYRVLMSEYSKYRGYAAYITCIEVKNYFPGGYVTITPGGQIKKIVEKPGINNMPSNMVNLVLHLHTRPSTLFNYIRSTRSTADNIYEKALGKMIAEHKLKAVNYKGNWIAIKYPWHVLEAMDYFSTSIRRKISNNVVIANSATIEGEVTLEKGVRVLEGATIRGPSYIGQNTIIGNNVLIRNSMIGNNNVIGYNTEIKHSYIGHNCWFHSNYIGDSVISDCCSFGAGSITANLRLDEKAIRSSVNNEIISTGHDKLGTFIGKNSRIGVNASIMPGIKIGLNCVIGPNICLNQDIASDMTIIEDKKCISLHRSSRGISRVKRNNFYQELTR